MYTKEYLMEHHIYDTNLNNELWKRLENKEQLTEQERDYVSYCYHYEEYKAGLL